VPEQELPAEDNNNTPLEVYEDLPHLERYDEWSSNHNQVPNRSESEEVPVRRSYRSHAPSDQNIRNIASGERVSQISELSTSSVQSQANRTSLFEYALSSKVGDIPIPDHYAEAHKSDENSEWTKAERRELESIKRFDTWKIVTIKSMKDKGKRAITCRWAYDLKWKNDDTGGIGTIPFYKARLCAKGFQQREGIDYNETFSAVARMATFRVILARSVELGLKVTHVDIGNAFLHGVLGETIYMHYPRGYKGKEDTILLLLKSIYGLKQASRVWGKKLAEVLLTIGFTPLKSDTCVFVNEDKSFWITVHVDDLLIATADEQARSNLLKGLSKIFKVKDLGVVSTYLGAHVSWAKDYCKIDQRVYIDKMIKRFSMEEAKPVITPNGRGSRPGQISMPLNCRGKRRNVRSTLPKPFRLPAICCPPYSGRYSLPDASHLQVQ
jgi:hypothetical protein